MESQYVGTGGPGGRQGFQKLGILAHRPGGNGRQETGHAILRQSIAHPGKVFHAIVYEEVVDPVDMHINKSRNNIILGTVKYLAPWFIQSNIYDLAPIKHQIAADYHGFCNDSPF